MSYLKDSFDIHAGGRDLIFPHHENEIAQSEGCTGKEFARYWVHNGYVNINAEKMSKSLDNFLTIRDILKKFPAEVMRVFLLSAHYRSPIDYTEQNILNANTSLERYYETKKRAKDCDKTKVELEELSVKLSKYKDDFKLAMDDDLNSAKVIGSVFELVRLLNKAIDEGKLSAAQYDLFINLMNETHEVIGSFGTDPDVYLTELKSKGISDSGISEEEILKLIDDRKQARLDKNFGRADEVRDELANKGIQLKDNPDGSTSWTVI